MNEVCSSEKSAAVRFCPLSPTIGSTFREDSTVRERVGVRGSHRSFSAPHPDPLPTANSSPKVTLPVGRGGSNLPLPTIQTHTREGGTSREVSTNGDHSL